MKSFIKLRGHLKLTAVLLVFSFVLTPLAPVYAEEILVSSSETAVIIPPNDVEPNARVESQTLEGPAEPSTETTIEETPQTEISEAPTPTEDTEFSLSSSEPDPVIPKVEQGKRNLIPELDKSAGAISYNFAIVTPPGRNGMEPRLSLSYNSSDTEESYFGYGWAINIPYIERLNKKGTNRLYTENDYISSLDGELVNIGTDQYAAKIEKGAFLKYKFFNNYWTVTDKMGTVYKFGESAGSRLDNPSDATQIFRWQLEEVKDTNGNFIKYTYSKDAGQIYPQKVNYTGNAMDQGIFEVSFSLLQKPAASITKNNKSGFAVSTAYVVNEIQVKASNLVLKKYALTYSPGTPEKRSLLQKVSETGFSEEGDSVMLPDTVFTYQNLAHENIWQQQQITFPVDVRNATVVDVNGDALPDIVYSYRPFQQSAINTTYINDGNNGFNIDPNYASPTLFWENNGGSNPQDLGARIVDVNGDGLADIIKGNSFESKAWLNNGNGWTLSPEWAPPLQFAHGNGSSSQDYEAQIADLNGDGLVDIVRAYSDPYNSGEILTWVYLNNGSGWTRENSWVFPIGIRFGTYLVDLNNDGLADILQSFEERDRPGSKVAYFNVGNGSWMIAPEYAPAISFTDISNSPSDKGVRPLDLNGDGLVDFIRAQAGISGLPDAVYLNTGSGWLQKSAASNLQSPLPFAFTNSVVDTGTRIADMNADGLPDLIRTYAGSSGFNSWMYLNVGIKTDLLTGVTYPTGGTTSISYKSSQAHKNGNILLNPKLPFPIIVADTISNNDSNGNISQNTYSYENGFYYYTGPYDRKFTGFGKITSKDVANQRTVAYFYQGNAIELGEYQDHISKAGNIYKTEVYSNLNILVAKNTKKIDNVSLSNGRNFVKTVHEVSYAMDSFAPQKAKAVLYTYNDITGNLTKQEELGEVSASEGDVITDVGLDKLTTNITYAVDTTGKILSAISKEEVFNQSNSKVKESRFYYDALTSGSVMKGNLTKEEKWSTGTSYVSNQWTYNGFGLITSKTDPRAKITSYAYDSYNLYPASVTNAVGQIVQFTYDYSSGKLKQKTDPNNLITQYIYDGLDRLREERQPDFSTPTNLVTKSLYQYTDTINNVSIKTSSYLDGSNIVDSYTYFDGLGRKIQERKEAEGSNFTVKDYIYNNLELLQKESLPYFGNGSAKVVPTTDAVLYTNYVYDPLSRIISVQNSVGTTTNTYNGWKTTVTSPRGKSRNLYTDAFGRLEKIEEFNSGSVYTTSYTYNGNNRLTKITDALGNVRNFTYDGLGRRLTAQDLHKPTDTTFGTWTYVYDNADNLSSRTDPKGQLVNFSYDNINRVLKEDFVGQIGYEVIYTYDLCTLGKGYLCSVTAGVSELKEYDALGNVKKETKHIDGVNYETNYQYDRQGNLINLTNPDGSQVKYTFNHAGLVETVQRKEAVDPSFTNVITGFDYGPHGKVISQTYVNGVITTNTYDVNKLYNLSNKVTTDGSSNIQNLIYTYDADGNITRIVDASDTDSAKTVDYTYDDLNRLLSATATNVASGQQTYVRTYTYNAIGNIINGDSGAYTYAGDQGSSYANPHAVTSIGTKNFEYDKNGNLFSDQFWAHGWDYNNRLLESDNGEETIAYTYDHTGQRATLTKFSGGTITYPTKYYNTDGITPTKHIYVGDQPIGTVKGTGTSTAAYFIHTDHLTGSNAITNEDLELEQILDYYPYGNVRVNYQSSGYDEQRKYAGSEYDVDTSLNYMNARYYDSPIGRFISQDPVFLAIGNSQQIKQLTNQEMWGLLSDPQSLNSYAYARNNPLRYNDPNGQFFKEAWAKAQEKTNQAIVWVGNKAEYAYQNNGAARWLLDHPNSGLYVAIGASVAVDALAIAAVAGITTIGTSCILNCGAGTPQSLLQASTKQQALSGVSDLPGGVQSSVKSFFKGGSNSYNGFAVTQNPDGTYTAVMSKPGNVPGSQAVYIKQIDSTGHTISVTKNTYDPKGNLVHSKDK